MTILLIAMYRRAAAVFGVPVAAAAGHALPAGVERVVGPVDLAQRLCGAGHRGIRQFRRRRELRGGVGGLPPPDDHPVHRHHQRPGRVAEVAARFTLDAMPGKQMSIDADLNAGLIGETGGARAARGDRDRRRTFTARWTARASSSKGDAIAGIVIIVVNILGGFVIGVRRRHGSARRRLQTYTLLTVGDGLVAQMPALLISTATGIIVTRAASEANLGADISRQILANPRALMIVSGLLMGFGLVPGLPKAPFFLIAVVVGGLALVLRRAQKAPAETETEEAKSGTCRQGDRGRGRPAARRSNRTGGGLRSGRAGRRVGTRRTARPHHLGAKANRL